MVINLLTGSISPQYHVVFDDMFSNVMSSTAADTEVWIRLVTSRNSRIQVMLDTSWIGSKPINRSISPQFHVVFDYMFSNVMSSTAADPEVWIRLCYSSH